MLPAKHLKWELLTFQHIVILFLAVPLTKERSEAKEYPIRREFAPQWKSVGYCESFLSLLSHCGDICTKCPLCKLPKFLFRQEVIDYGLQPHMGQCKSPQESGNVGFIY